METQDQDHSRIGRRRPRMSETETRERALQTAVDALVETGLSVGLDHISMEDVIREAGVSRTAVYRLWPKKEDFIGDLILELAESAIPGSNMRGQDVTKQVSDFLLPRLDELATPALRWQLALQMTSAVAAPDFEHTTALAAQWRTYFALVATIMNLPNDELRENATSAMGKAENRYRERLATNYRVIADLLGFRLAAPARIDFEAVADLVIAMVRGFTLRNQTVSAPTSLHRLLGAGVDAVLSRCFEVDPHVVWDTEQLHRLRSVLTGSRNLFEAYDAKR